MNYRCPHCKNGLSVAKLFFSDISACRNCGQKVVLGDFLAFFMAAISMSVAALTTLYIVTNIPGTEYYVAAGYAVSVGMAAGLAVLFLLGRATPHRRMHRRVATGGATMPGGPTVPGDLKTVKK
jgi:hypothetical protein